MRCIDTGRVSLFFEGAGSGAPPVLALHELDGSRRKLRAGRTPNIDIAPYRSDRF